MGTLFGGGGANVWTDPNKTCSLLFYFPWLPFAAAAAKFSRSNSDVSFDLPVYDVLKGLVNYVKSI